MSLASLRARLGELTQAAQRAAKASAHPDAVMEHNAEACAYRHAADMVSEEIGAAAHGLKGPPVVEEPTKREPTKREMTLRDFFAAHVVNGLTAVNESNETIAAAAYNMADALLAERARRAEVSP